MTASAMPAVLRAMLNQFTAALPGVNVSLGLALDNDMGDSLYIGVSDPQASNYTSGASGAQSWPVAAASVRTESLTVNLMAEAWAGDGDTVAAIDRAFAIFETVAATVNVGGHDLGVAGVSWGNVGEAYSLDHAQTPDGAAALLTFTITATAQLT